jgi:hypothetical protein
MKINKTVIWRVVSVFRVWFQTFISIEIALHIKDLMSGKFFWQVCLAAFLPVGIRWMTPQDQFPDERTK